MVTSSPSPERLSPDLIDALDRAEIAEMFSQQLPGNPRYTPDARIIASEYEALGVCFNTPRKGP